MVRRGIDLAATMSWTSTAASAYVVEIICFVMNSGVYQGSIVTAGTSAQLVADADTGVAIPPGAQRFWDEMPGGGTSAGTRGATFTTK